MTSRFAAALRRTARELDLPPHVRAEILLELAADLDAAYEHQCGRGISDAEAAHVAEERILGSPELLRRLARLHAGSPAGRLGGLGTGVTGGLGRVLLVVAVAPALVLAGAVGIGGLLSTPPGPLDLVVPALGIAAVAVVAREGIRLAAGGMPPRERLRLLFLVSLAAPALGVLAAAAGVHAVGADLSTAGPGAAAAVPEVLERLIHHGSVLVVGLLVGIAGGLAWFALVEAAARRAEREAAALLEEGLPARLARPRGIIPLERRRRRA